MFVCPFLKNSAHIFMQLWPHKAGHVPNAHISVIIRLSVLIQPSTALLICTLSIFGHPVCLQNTSKRASMFTSRYVAFKHVRDEGCNKKNSTRRMPALKNDVSEDPPQARRVATSKVYVSKKQQPWTYGFPIKIDQTERNKDGECSLDIGYGRFDSSLVVFPCPQRLKNYS